MRILPAIRLSLTTDNTTSPERQFEKIDTYARLHDHELVTITEADYDLDVSGAVSPFDRPGLGRWLKPDRLDQWDAICAAKLDRISRSLFDFTALVQWLEAHDKTLIILDPMLDLSTKEGRAMANVLMTFAEYERDTIAARVKEAYDKLVASGKYTGGMVPFGYRPVKLSKNWGYEKDPEYAPVVAEMADRFLRYESLGSIAKWLRESGVPSPKDVIRKRNGKPMQGTPWTATVVRMILSSPAVLGAVTTTRGVAMHDDQGMVIYRADPLITRDQFERIQARLAQNPVPVRMNSTPLLQVAFCSCGAPMHSTTTNRKSYPSDLKAGSEPVIYAYRYYHCHNSASLNGRCKAKRVRAELLEDAVFGTLLDLAGSRKLRRERLIAGRDHSEESARLIEQTQHLQAEISRARLARKDYSNVQAMLDKANAELDRIALLEPEPARIEYDETNQTFQNWWDLNDPTARNAFMREQGIKVIVSPDPLPEDLVLPRPEMIFSVAAIERPGMHAILYLGNLADLLNRASDLSITVSQR